MTDPLAQAWAAFEHQDLHQRLVETAENTLAPAFDWKTADQVTSGLVFGTRLSAIGPPALDAKTKANPAKSNILHALKASGAQPSMLAMPDALDQDLLLVSMGLAELRIWWPNAMKLGLPMAIARVALGPSVSEGIVVDWREIPSAPVSKTNPSPWATLWNLAKGAPEGSSDPITGWLEKLGALPGEHRPAETPPVKPPEIRPPEPETQPTEPLPAVAEPPAPATLAEPAPMEAEPAEPEGVSLAGVQSTAKADLEAVVSKTDFAEVARELVAPARRRAEARLVAAMSATDPNRPELATRIAYARATCDLALSGLASDFANDMAVSAALARETVRADLANKLKAAVDANPLPEIDPGQVGRTLARRLDAATAQANADRERITAAFDARILAQRAALEGQVKAEAAAKAHTERVLAVRGAAGAAVDQAISEWLGLETQVRAALRDNYQNKYGPRLAGAVDDLERDLAAALAESQATQPRHASTTPDTAEIIIDAEVMPFEQIIQPSHPAPPAPSPPGTELMRPPSMSDLPMELRLLLAQTVAASQPSRWPMTLAAAGVGAVVVALILALVLWLGGGLSLFGGKPDPMDDVKAAVAGTWQTFERQPIADGDPALAGSRPDTARGPAGPGL
jgi:hypothetical protein